MAELTGPAPFGRLPDGQLVDRFTLTSKGGLSLRVMTLGGIVTHLFVPDRNGNVADVVLGFDRLDDYLKPHPYFGAIAGRVAGRISGARFDLDGHSYVLAANDPPNHLHGGLRGFDKRLWTAQPVRRTGDDVSLKFTRTSPNDEEGYPGTVRVSVTYTVTDANEFRIDSEATTDRATPFSLTHHSYFNLAGESSGSVESHQLKLNASTYAPGDANFGLLGRRDPVAANDFRTAKPVGDVVPNLHGRHGDLYFIDRPQNATGLVDAARLVDPTSGRVMTVRSTEACIQLYTGVGLDGSLVGKAGRPYESFAGLCLECEGYPDGANRPALGDIVLRPGQIHRQTTVYAFSNL